MDGAASAITIVGLALNSADLIRKLISNFKNAPEAIQQTSIAIGDLSKFLRQLYTYSGSLEHAADLPELLGRCGEDLKKFKKKIEKFVQSPGDKKRNIIRKNIRAALQEKEISQMNGVIEQYLQSFSMQMHLLEATKAATEATNLRNVQNSVLANFDLLSLAVGSTSRIPKEIGDSISEALGKVGDRFDNLDGISSAQTQTLSSILELLQQLVPEKTDDTKEMDIEQRRPEITNDGEIESEQPQALDNDNFQEALDRLSRIAKDKKGSFFSLEAAAIIQDVEQILTSLINARVCASSKNGRKGKRKRQSTICQIESDSESDLKTMREMKRVKGLLVASHCLDLNPKNIGATKSWKIGSSKMHYLKNEHHCYDSPNGSVTIQTRRARRLGINPDFFLMTNKGQQQGWTEVLEAYMTIMPRNKAIWFAMRFQQELSYEGSFLREPILNFSAVVPHNSSVFQVIMQNDLDGLIDLLWCGKASLTDRDPNGRCLLNVCPILSNLKLTRIRDNIKEQYALTYDANIVCKYLIDHGADVDFIEHGSDQSNRHSLFIGLGNDPADIEVKGRSQECHRLLLQAGADPTVSCPSGILSYAQYLANWCDEDLWPALLNYSGDLIRMEQNGGLDALLITCLEGSLHDLNHIKLLIRQNPDLTTRSKGGLTCLHIALLKPYAFFNRKKLLVILIEAGADIHAKDHNGFEPSDYAYNIRPQWGNGTTSRLKYFEGTWHVSSDADLLLQTWMDALEECSYDANKEISKANLFNHKFEALAVDQNPEETHFKTGQDGSSTIGSQLSFNMSTLPQKVGNCFDEDEELEIRKSSSSQAYPVMNGGLTSAAGWNPFWSSDLAILDLDDE